MSTSEKEFIKKLENLVLIVNENVESYISSEIICSIKQTLRTRTVINVVMEKGCSANWIFLKEDVAKMIHQKLKEVLLLREYNSFEKATKYAEEQEKSKGVKP
jgi:hypothetical protein